MSSSNQNNVTESYQPGEPTFDVNTIVVLAALLCALIAALTLNSVIKYALRHRRESLEASQATAGSEKHTMKKIPVEVFRSGVDIPATECSICLGEFVDGEKIRVLPECNHEFHVKCVDKWLVDHMSCPNCRQLVALPREGVKYEGEYDHHDRVVLDFMV